MKRKPQSKSVAEEPRAPNFLDQTASVEAQAEGSELVESQDRVEEWLMNMEPESELGDPEYAEEIISISTDSESDGTGTLV